MSSKKDYLNLIRWSCIIDSFNNHYFIRIIVIYLLSRNVTPWVAVSLPIVIDFAKLISRSFSPAVKLALRLDYKKYHIFHLIMFLCLGLIISQCRSIYTIYLFAIISGILTGIKNSTITKLNTQNKEYEPFCFIEEERSQVIGGSIGLITSQILYDVNPKLYLLGYIILVVIGFILSSMLSNIKDQDEMLPMNESTIITKDNKRNTILITTLFGVLAGLWCMGLSGFEELAPLISNKLGYLNAVYTILEIILLCLISGSILQKIKVRKKLLFTETIIAIIDCLCLFIAALTLSWQGLLLAYIITAITSTLGDPIWGSIMSLYSTNDRTKWVLVNKVYFIIRAIFMLLSWYVCRICVINGVNSFKYLAIILIVLIIGVYLISNNINKKIFKSSI